VRGLVLSFGRQIEIEEGIMVILIGSRVKQSKNLIKEEDCGGDENFQGRERDTVKKLVLVIGVCVCERERE